MDITSASSAPSNPLGISLSKGGKISLAKNIEKDPRFTVGLGWDLRSTSGQAYDLDASVFVTNADSKLRTNEDFVFYGNLSHPSGAVVHTGDNLTGEGDGDDEVIKFDFSKLESEIEHAYVVVSIHEAQERNQNFGQVSNAYIRILDSANEVVARFDLSEDADTNTALIFGEFYKHNGEWKFKAVGDGWTTGLQGLVEKFS